jgi:hypothetical protein
MAKTLIAVFLLLVTSTVNAQENRPSKVEEILYHSSQVALVGGLAVDLVSTWQGINNPVHVAYDYCVDGTLTCVVPNHAVATIAFREIGPASWFGIQSPGAVVVAGVAFNAGVLTVSHLLYGKGRVWRKIAIGINIFQAGNHLLAGMGNISMIRSAKVGLVPAGAFSVRW